MRLWDLETGQILHRLEGRKEWGFIFRAASLADSDRVLFGTQKGLLILWDLETGRELQRIQGAAIQGRLALLPEERLALTADAAGCLRLWSVPQLGDPASSKND